jgi:hypothetical protein
MKTTFVIAVLSLLLAATAVGQNVGITAGIPLTSQLGGTLGVKVFASSNFAVVGGLNFATTSAGGGSQTTFGFNAGGLYHFNKSQLSPNLGGAILLNVTSPPAGNSLITFGIIFGGGAEYFATKQFSVAGFMGLGFTTTNTTPSTTTFGTFSAVTLAWYFN